MTPSVKQVKKVNVRTRTRTRSHSHNNNDDDLGHVYNFYKQFPKENQHHVEDLHATTTHKPQVLVMIPPLTYVVYIHRVLRNVIITLVFEWTMPIFHPFNFLLLVTVFPTLIITVIILEVALNIGYKLGLEDLIRHFGEKWADGLSIVNWWDPRIFRPEVDGIVKDGIKALNAPLPPPVPESELDDSIFGAEGSIQHRSFHLDMAELLLFMSSIIYERSDNLVRSAHKKMEDIIKESKVRAITEDDVSSITKKLKESESRIHKQAAQWNLKFTSLSELNSLGGPFSGMFWSEENNFIVVVFKGTTPSNFEDFVVDLMFQRVDARSFVFGEVHEGFYSSLFPQNSFDTTRASRSSPYISMVRAIRAKAADIINLRPDDQKNEKINIWVTGHSLGAALASLFYTRLMKSPEDLGPNSILRDGYMFGSPSVGDADFAAEFASYSNTPYDRQNTLWRIIDDTDIITKLPPGWSDPSVRRLVDKSSILNYAHVGEGIRFLQNGDKPVCTRNLFSSGKEPVIIEHTDSFNIIGQYKWYGRRSNNEDKLVSGKNVFKEYKHDNPLHFVEKCLPTFFRNHLPGRYFAVMEKSRIYFDGLGTAIEEEAPRSATRKSIDNVEGFILN